MPTTAPAPHLPSFFGASPEELIDCVVSNRAAVRGIDVTDADQMSGLRKEFMDERNAILAAVPRPPKAITAEEIAQIAADQALTVVAANRPRQWPMRVALGFAFIGVLAVAWKSTMDERELWGQLAPTVYNVHWAMDRIGALETQMATLTTPPTIQAEETPAPTAAPTEDPVAFDARLSKECANYRWTVEGDPAKGAVLIDCPDKVEHPCTTLNVAEGHASGCS